MKCSCLPGLPPSVLLKKIPSLILLFSISFLSAQSTQDLASEIRDNLKSGKIVKAQQLAAKLYKTDKGQTADLTYLSAGVAEAAGDEATAVKRYLSFLSVDKSKNDKTKNALTYLLIKNPNTDLLERFIKDYGTFEIVLAQGQTVLQELLENDDSEGACRLARLLSTAYGTEEVNYLILTKMKQHNRVFSDKDSRSYLFNYLTSLKKVSSRSAYDLLRSFERTSDPAVYMRTAGDIQLNTAKPLNNTFSSVFSRLPTLKNDQKKAALKFLAHQKVCLESHQYFDYLSFIARNPKVFKKGNDELIDGSKISDKFSALLKLYNEPKFYVGQLGGILTQIAAGYMDKTAQQKFLSANKQFTVPDYRKAAEQLDDSDALQKAIKNAVQSNRFNKNKSIKAALSDTGTVAMVSGRDTSARGKAVKLLHDAHLAYAQIRNIADYAQTWAPALKDSELFWEVTLKNMNNANAHSKAVAEAYLTHLDKTKVLPDYGREFLLQNAQGVSSPAKLGWLRTQYDKLGTDALKIVAKQRWKMNEYIPEALHVLKSVKGDVDKDAVLAVIRPMAGQKLAKILKPADLKLILKYFEGQPAEDFLSIAQIAARGFDRKDASDYIKNILSGLKGSEKFSLINKMYTSREFNNHRSVIDKALLETASQIKSDGWYKIIVDTSLISALYKNKSPEVSTLLLQAANNELWLRNSTSYLAEGYYKVLNEEIAKGDWANVIPLLSSWSKAAASYAGDRNFVSRTLAPLIKKLEEKNGSEAIYMSASLMLAKVSDSNAKKLLTRIRSKAANGIENLIPVDKKDKRYDLYIAAESLALGDIAKAWKLTEPKVDLVKSNWSEFDENYIIWVAGQLLEENENKGALELIMTVLLEEASLNRETATALALLKGDVYRAEENYPAARTEYQALVNNPVNSKTEAGKNARYRLVDLMILTKDYGSAELELNRLVDSSSLETQAEANYYLAKLYYQQKEYVTSNEYLQQTFKRIHGHVAGRLLEGELKLHLPRGLANTEIAVGRLDLQTVVIPGSTLTLKLQDRNLAIARGGKAIPVDIVTTSGDKEFLSLLPSESDPTLFVGQIPSVLGKIGTNNGKLEIRGEDKISYAISKDFQKQNKINYPSKEMVIKANARLRVSSGKITDDENKKGDAAEDETFILTKRDEINKGLQVRPGSPVYIEVKDFDRDISEKKDKVTVDIRTTSGDVLEGLELEESSEHSGIFKAEVKTGIPFPLVTASDIDENQDTNAIINSGRKKVWSSIADSKKSKWLEVDTMSSYELKEVGIKLVKQNVKSIKLYGQLDNDQFLIGAFPESADGAGGLQAMIVDGTYRTLFDLKKALKFNNKSVSLKSPLFQRSTSEFGKRNNWASSFVTGTFWLNQSQTLKLKLMHKPGVKEKQYTMVYVDDKLVMGSTRMNAADFDRIVPLFLKKGAHKLEIFNFDHIAKSTVQLGYEIEDGSFEILPEKWFSTAANPGLEDLLKPKGKMTKTEDGFKMNITSPVRLRKIRWVFEDYNGTQVEVAEINAVDQHDKVILPVANDFTSGKSNRSLEIAAGDRISIKYKDEKRLGRALAVLEQKMNATFANAEISMVYEVDGEEAEARRVRKGDQVLITVTDFDEDSTPKPDIIVAKVRARSGAEMDLKLLETENNSGVFTQILSFGDKTEKDTIAIKDNDEITVSYLDKENNSPGIPTDRVVTVETPVLSQPSLMVYKTSVQQIEDRSAEAEKKKRRILGMNPDLKNVTLYKNQILVEDKHSDAVSLNAPLLIKLLYPQAVRHSLSKYTIEAVSQSQLDAAKKAPGKETDKLKLEEKAAESESGYTPIILRVGDIRSRAGDYSLSMIDSDRLDSSDAMEIGLLTAAVHLQLGSPGDEIVNADDDIPTLIVKGSDTVHIRVKDDEGKVVIEEKIELRSDARLSLLDRNYSFPVNTIHMGQRFYLQVTDPDQDTSDERDTVSVTVKTASGSSVTHKLSETLNHSGVFTAPLKPEFAVKAAAGKPAEKKHLTAEFGDSLTFSYKDEITLSGKADIKAEGKIYKGADGQMSVFTKRFKDEDMAVKTRFLMAEALFEMAREHRKLKKIELADTELARGKRILQEAIRDYPNTSLKVQGEYLLANLAQELKKYEEGISRYSKVISNWPDSEYAPKAQFKKAICLEKMKELDRAAEEYVKVTYLYPGSDLTSDAVIRMASLYFKQQKYDVASKIYQRFQRNYPDHRLASRSYFMAANCLILEQKANEEYNAKIEEGSKKKKKRVNYVDAIEILAKLAEKYKDDKEVRPEAMYWLGDCQFKNKEYTASYQTYKKLTWDYPESKWAKIARGRLTDEKFENIEEVSE